MERKLEVQVHIETPCSENLDAMPSTIDGRFCTTCQKVVVDFTRMSDSELVWYFEQHTNERVCGRLSEQQLNRKIVAVLEPEHRWNFKGVLNKVAALLVLLPVAGSYAQKAGTTKKQHATAKPRIKPVDNVIKGLLLDINTQKPVSGVELKIETLNIKMLTDTNGHFEFQLPEVFSDSGVTLEATRPVTDSFFINPTRFDLKELKSGQPVKLYREMIEIVPNVEVRGQSRIERMHQGDIAGGIMPSIEVIHPKMNLKYYMHKIFKRNRTKSHE